MAGRALLAGYHRYIMSFHWISVITWQSDNNYWGALYIRGSYWNRVYGTWPVRLCEHYWPWFLSVSILSLFMSIRDESYWHVISVSCRWVVGMMQYHTWWKGAFRNDLKTVHKGDIAEKINRMIHEKISWHLNDLYRIAHVYSKLCLEGTPEFSLVFNLVRCISIWILCSF